MPHSRLLAVAAWWLIGFGAANAQSLQLLPVTVELSGTQRAASLVVRNMDSRPAVIQARAFLWRQTSEGDELTVTRQLILSPPIAEVPPGGAQVIRLLLRQPATDSEDTYRILIDGLPPSGSESGIRMGLRFSVPLFAVARQGLKPNLSWRVEMNPDGSADLVARNDGKKHARVLAPVIETGNAKRLEVKAGLHSYVLASSERRWAVLGDTHILKTDAPTRVIAKTDQGEISQSANVVRP
jgi:fimbrial chaperone protein